MIPECIGNARAYFGTRAVDLGSRLRPQASCGEHGWGGDELPCTDPLILELVLECRDEGKRRRVSNSEALGGCCRGRDCLGHED